MVGKCNTSEQIMYHTDACKMIVYVRKNEFFLFGVVDFSLYLKNWLGFIYGVLSIS